MELEHITMLSEMSDKAKHCIVLLNIWNLKKPKMRFFQTFEFQGIALCQTSSNTYGGSCKESSQNPRKKIPNRTSLSVTLAGKQTAVEVLFSLLSPPGVLCCWFVWVYSFCRLTFSGKMSDPVPKTMWPVNSRAYHSYWRKFLCLLLKILVRINWARLSVWAQS